MSDAIVHLVAVALVQIAVEERAGKNGNGWRSVVPATRRAPSTRAPAFVSWRRARPYRRRKPKPHASYFGRGRRPAPASASSESATERPASGSPHREQGSSRNGHRPPARWR